MNNWPYRPLSDFLIEREGRFKPNDPKIASYKRLDKINFSGKIHISEKPSKTDMIIIEPGDLVISGINVAKGALAVYDGDKPVTATIHYSSYEFNKNKIDIDFLKRFLKSPAFISELQDQVKGGIKTEIKPKHLLPLKARIPELAEQQKINYYFDAIDNEISDLSNEVNTQSSYITKLRQAILQEAIEGKLTAEWRKENPVRKGNPDYDAEALLEKIQAEKEKLIKEGKIKKQKPLAPIKAEGVPFELPEGWVWTRFGGILKNPPRNGYSPKEVNYETKVKSLKLGATTWGVFNPLERKFIDEDIPDDSVFWLKPNDILIQRSNSIDYVGVTAIYTGKENEFIYPDLMMKLEIVKPISILYSHKVLSAPFCREYFRKNAKGAQKSMPKINQGVVNDTIIPIPPLAEQQAIVDRLEKLLSMVDELKKQVSERKEQSEQLMQAVLREAFEGGK
jgi:type I restriction enzyme, S subunit